MAATPYTSRLAPDASNTGYSLLVTAYRRLLAYGFSDP